MTSLFTNIIRREIPAEIVYEDDEVIAFLDINPVNQGHTLVVPKQEFVSLETIPTENIGPFFERVQKIARAVVSGVDAQGYNLIMNTGPASGQEIMHAHAHIIPRFDNDGYTHWKGDPYPTEQEKHNIANQIRRRIVT